MSVSMWAWYSEAAKIAVGFFWKSGWTFVLGYTISAMIQSFVPKVRLTTYMGKVEPKRHVSHIEPSMLLVNEVIPEGSWCYRHASRGLSWTVRVIGRRLNGHR